MTFIKHTAISFLNKHHLRHSELNFKRLKKAANQGMADMLRHYYSVLEKR